MIKINVKMDMLVYLGISIPNRKKIVMYQNCYDYVKSKSGKKAKLRYTDTGSSIVHVKLEDIYAELNRGVKKINDKSNYEVGRPLLNYREKQKIGLMKYILGEKITKEIVALRYKTYSYLTDNDCVDRKVKGTKMCIIKPKIKFRTTKGTRRYQGCDKVAGTSCTCIH